MASNFLRSVGVSALSAGAVGASRSMTLAAAIVMLCGSAGSLQAETGTAFGREGTIKVRVPKSLLTPQFLRTGARVVAEYENFAVVEVAAGAAPAVQGAEVLTQENKILLNAGALDTTTAAVKSLQKARGQFNGKTLHMIQFAGPIQPAWYNQMTQTGVEVVTYIPSNSYLVYGDSKQLGALQAMASASAQVQWNGNYQDSYKIDPGAVALMNDPKKLVATDEYFSIQLVKDAAANARTMAVVNRLRSGPVTSEYDNLNYHNVVVAIPPGLIPTVAAQPEVVSIQAYGKPVMFDERQDQIVAGNLSGNLPSAPGYLAWLASMGFTQAQFDASAFVVDVSDSSIDQGNTSPNHFGLHAGGLIAGASRVMYAREVSGTTLTTPSPFHGCDGHGNLNAHIISGFDNSSGFPFADSSGYHYGLGVSPFGRVGSSVIFNSSDAYTSPNFTTLQSNAYNNGARISSNSWGNTGGNTYNTDAQTYDTLVRDAQPTGSSFPVAGNQEMVIVFANGNSGSGANTVHPPATGKNLISVGAAENVQAFGGADGSGVDDSGANSANDIISFSSRGPCSDGRKKPEIMAPGTHVSGGVAQANPVISGNGAADACYNGSGVSGGVGSIFFPSGQAYYTASSGTSHSTPCVAGGCALVRQFFINQGMAPPSPAMTKAILMNSARYMTGTGANDTLWSNNQGMGEMNLGETFKRGAVTPTVFRDEQAVDMFTATGQSRSYSGNIADGSKPYRVTLAWTDAPGTTTGTASKNNLDLTVTIGANTYKGNVFSGANSVTGGAADTLNNVESVFLPAGTTGAFTVTVTAANINSDGVPNTGGTLDQDFALVIYNGTTGCTPATVSVASDTATACPSASVTLTATPAGTPPFAYQWRLNSTPIGGATNPTYVIGAPLPQDAGSYDCLISNACGNNSSNAVSLGVCYANCDCSNTPPVVNVGDFLCFVQKFQTNDPAANCDGSTTVPTLNIADFTCFLQQFAAGCP